MEKRLNIKLHCNHQQRKCCSNFQSNSRVMRSIIFILVQLFLLVGCKTGQNGTSENVQFTVMEQSNLYGNGKEGLVSKKLIISNNKDWEQLLNKMGSLNSSRLSDEPVNFTKYDVIAIFDQIRPSSGYSFVVDLHQFKDCVTVETVSIAPQGPAASVITQPYVIIQIEKTNLPIKFN